MIYKRRETRFWWYDVQVAGQRRRGSTGTADKGAAMLVEATIRQAMTTRDRSQAARLKAVIDAALGVVDDGRGQGLPLESVWAEVERLLTVGRKELSRKTLRDKRGALKRFREWAARKWPAANTAQDVDRHCAQAFAASLSELSSKRVANVIGELSSCWRLLQRSHDGLDNPWPAARPMRVESTRGLAFSPEEARRVIAAGDRLGHGWGLACRIAAVTGLRYGDVALLRGDSIVGGVIRLRPKKTTVHGIEVAIPLPPEVAAMVPQTEGELFPDLARGYRSSSQVFQACPFAAVLEAAGLAGRGFTFHSWRHFFRSALSRAGVADDIAKRLGGWTNDKTALRYDHDGRLSGLAEATAAAWRAASGDAAD